MGDIEFPQFIDTSFGAVIFGASKSRGKSVRKANDYFHELSGLFTMKFA